MAVDLKQRGGKTVQTPLSERAGGIPHFRAMDILARATELEAEGRDIVHMELGEPDAATPRHVIDAAKQALDQGFTRYTPTEGYADLRVAVAAYYAREYGVQVDPERVFVTMGVSPAQFLAFSLLADTEGRVVMGDPCYASYPHTARYLGLEVVRVPLSGDDGWRLNADKVRPCLTGDESALLVNSPANPTGTVLHDEDLKKLVELPVPLIVSDEIYHRLVYGERARSILEFASPERCVVLNGFSKVYGMTGWRIGWMIVPAAWIEPLKAVHQHFFLSANAFVQRAALAALENPQDSVDAIVDDYRLRRNLLLEGLRAIGWTIPCDPEGAFYILADGRRWENNSLRMARRILEEAGVAVTPGIDFGTAAEGHIRFSYSASLQRIKEGLSRLSDWAETVGADPRTSSNPTGV